jgi:hypothetical protein
MAEGYAIERAPLRYVNGHRVSVTGIHVWMMWIKEVEKLAASSVFEHNAKYTKDTGLFANNLYSLFLKFYWNFHEQVETVL